MKTRDLVAIEGREFRDLICKHLVVKASVANLDANEYLSFCRKMGRLRKPRQKYTHPEHEDLFLVTNKRNEKGEKTGLFADGEIGWHANGVCIPNLKEICVGLYCIKPGEGSVTKWLNSRAAYQSLLKSEKEKYNKINLSLSFENERFYKFDKNDFEMKVLRKLGEVEKPLVFKHPVVGDLGFYFPHHFISNFRDEEEVFSNLQEMLSDVSSKVFQDKYIYEHHWQKGDLIFSDQIHSLHKRNDFIGERLLYRTAFDYSAC